MRGPEDRTRQPWMIYAFATLAVAPLASCGDRADHQDEAACARWATDPERIDAIEWLKTPTEKLRRLGTLSVDEALGLAHAFEAAGARGIVAVNVDRYKQAYPPDGSLGVVVELPDGPEKRLSVFRLYAKQVRGNGLTPSADTGQKYLFIPWTREDGGAPSL